MSLAKLELTEESKLVFNVNVSGTSENVTNYRLVIENEDFDIVCKGEVSEEGVEVTVPKLKNILESGIYKTKLEVIIGDKIFTPLHEALELLPNIELKVESKKFDKDDAQTVKVEVGGATKVKSIVQEAKEQGYTIVNSEGRTVLKNEKGYCGLIEGEEIVLAKEPKDFLFELYKELDV